MASRYSDHRRYLELGKSGSHSYQTPHSHSALAGDVASLPCKWRWVAVCVTALPEAHQQLSIYCSTFTYQSCVNFLWHLLFCTSLEGKNKQIMLSVFEFIFNYYVASFKYCLSGLKKKNKKTQNKTKKNISLELDTKGTGILFWKQKTRNRLTIKQAPIRLQRLQFPAS